MRDLFIGMVVGMVLITSIYFFARSNKKETIPQSFEINIQPDTVAKYIPVIETKIDSSGKIFWKSKYDSLQNIVDGIDTTKSPDSTFAEYFLPFKATVKDSLTENFLTVYPLNPIPLRVKLDSTIYKSIKFDTLITIPTPVSKKSLSSLASVAVGAGAGAAIANIPGAMIGAAAGLVFDWLFVP
jgi:hypothetical protein